MSMHSDYLDPDRYFSDPERDNQLVKQAFEDFDGLEDLYRSLYKRSECGVTIGALIQWWETVVYDEPLIEWLDDGPVQTGTTQAADSVQQTKWFYGDALGQFGDWAAMDHKGQAILKLSVSSIVEGVEQPTQTIEIDTDPDNYEDAAELRKAFDEALRQVELEAEEISKQA